VVFRKSALTVKEIPENKTLNNNKPNMAKTTRPHQFFMQFSPPALNLLFNKRIIVKVC